MGMDYIENARKALERGDYDEIHHLEASHLLKVTEVSSLVNSMFTSYYRNKNYSQAVSLAKAFQLPNHQVHEAVEKYFNELILESAFDRAIEWGNRNGLSKEELSGAAEKYCRSRVEKGEIEKALEIKKDFALPGDKLKDSFREAALKAIQNKRFEEALKLAGECDLPENILFKAIKNLMQQYLAADKPEKLKEIAGRHKFLTDGFFDKIRIHEQMEMVDCISGGILKKYIYDGRFDIVIEFIKESGVLSFIPRNPQLLKLQHAFYSALEEVHKTYFLRENTADAITVATDFNLLDSPAPPDVLTSVSNSAKKYHGELLKKGDIEAAIRIRDHYKLYERTPLVENIFLWDDPVMLYLENALARLDTDGALKAIETYGISKDQVQTISKRIIRAQMEQKNFRFVFELLKKFRVSSLDKDIVSMAENFFDDSMKESHFEIAADLGYYFHLHKKVTHKAAFETWKKHMNSGKLNEAGDIVRRHKLPHEMIEAAARDIYQYYLNSNPETAKRIREEYHINLNILELIIEIIKKILSVIFSGKKEGAVM